MKCMKVLVHQQPYKEILRSFGLEKLLSLRWSSSSWFLLGLICLWIATLEIVLPNHTWNMIISSKPCFVIIKIKINQTLVSHKGLAIKVLPFCPFCEFSDGMRISLLGRDIVYSFLCVCLYTLCVHGLSRSFLVKVFSEWNIWEI